MAFPVDYSSCWLSSVSDFLPMLNQELVHYNNNIFNKKRKREEKEKARKSEKAKKREKARKRDKAEKRKRLIGKKESE